MRSNEDTDWNWKKSLQRPDCWTSTWGVQASRKGSFVDEWWTDRQTDGWTDAWMNTWMERGMDARMERWMGEWIDAGLDAWMDGWMNR